MCLIPMVTGWQRAYVLGGTMRRAGRGQVPHVADSRPRYLSFTSEPVLSSLEKRLGISTLRPDLRSKRRLRCTSTAGPADTGLKS